MGASPIHVSVLKPAYPALQGDRQIPESTKAESHNQIVWKSG